MKFDLTPLQAEKAIEALTTMYEQTDRTSYLVTAQMMETQLEAARADVKQVQATSLFS